MSVTSFETCLFLLDRRNYHIRLPLLPLLLLLLAGGRLLTSCLLVLLLLLIDVDVVLDVELIVHVDNVDLDGGVLSQLLNALVLGTARLLLQHLLLLLKGLLDDLVLKYHELLLLRRLLLLHVDTPIHW